MAHQFSQVPQAKTPRSSFKRDHVVKTTFDAGLIVPIYLDEVLPGDTHSLRASMFGRMATPLRPLLDNLFMDTFFFFVPTRLVWDNWQKFNGEQDNPGDSTDYSIPTITYDGTESDVFERLADYLGLPVNDTVSRTVNALPFRCYNLIYNEWFRDQNLINSLTVSKDDGPELTTRFAMKRRGKRHDYFTSCLPWPQKGPESVISLGSTAPVGADLTKGSGSVGFPIRVGDLEVAGQAYGMQVTSTSVDWTASSTSGPITDLYADLSQATAITINQLRESFQIQKLLERDARGGTRYTEIIRSHFGVTSPDARLQRPEFLGGGTSMININPVAATAWSDVGQGAGTVVPQGFVGAYGTMSATGHGFTKSFTEHGYILGFVNVRADLTYQQGINRLWSRTGRYDFYWPALSHLGEQSVLNKEIYSALQTMISFSAIRNATRNTATSLHRLQASCVALLRHRWTPITSLKTSRACPYSARAS
jgi:hypothetical protein